MAAVGGLGIFGFSFAPFVQYDLTPNDAQMLMKNAIPTTFSAWSGETFMLPLSIFPVLMAFFVIALVAWGMRPVGGLESAMLSSRQWMLATSIGAFLIVFGYAVSTKSLLFGTAMTSLFQAGNGNSIVVTFGWGGVMMLVMALVQLGGAVLHFFGLGPDLLTLQAASPVPAGAPTLVAQTSGVPAGMDQTGPLPSLPTSGSPGPPQPVSGQPGGSQWRYPPSPQPQPRQEWQWYPPQSSAGWPQTVQSPHAQPPYPPQPHPGQAPYHGYPQPGPQPGYPHPPFIGQSQPGQPQSGQPHAPQPQSGQPHPPQPPQKG